jgi:hypothetical protein
MTGDALELLRSDGAETHAQENTKPIKAKGRRQSQIRKFARKRGK